MLDMDQTILAAAKRRDGREYHFMICDMCFWCASVFGPDLSRYCGEFLCPVCKGSKLETIPLASDEVFRSKMLLKQQAI
jgi:hypothetical protein